MEHPTWIRVAGHAANIKAKHHHVWRCYTEANPDGIALKNWSVKGMASGQNFIPGVNPNRDQYGLTAWIDCFGTYAIENEVLVITLQEPPTQNTLQ